MQDPRLPAVYQEKRIIGPSRRCLNADNKKMYMICQLATAGPDKELCDPCIDYADQLILDAQAHERAKRPRVMGFVGSKRPCQITPGCAGTMSAALKWVAGNRADFPELYWHCAACSAESLWATGFAKRATAKSPIVSFVPRVEAAKISNRKKFLGMSGHDVLDAYKSETAEMSDHIKNIIGETPKPELVRISEIACDGSGPRTTCGCSRCVAYYKDQRPNSEELT